MVEFTYVPQPLTSPPGGKNAIQLSKCGVHILISFLQLHMDTIVYSHVIYSLKNILRRAFPFHEIKS